MTAQLDETGRSTAVEPSDEPPPAGPAATEDSVLADVLVEEISIDGMCGVY